MTSILAFDTSTSVGSVALGRGGGVIASRTIGSSVRHAESLLPAISEVLDEGATAMSDLAAVVVAGGPGSFTGVRIAAATARGLVRALEIPLLAYGSLLAAAAAARRTDVPVCALFDARRGEVYAGCYRFTKTGWTTVRPAGALPLAEVLAAPETRGALFSGEGVSLLTDDTRVAEGQEPTAVALLRLARLDEAAGRIAEPAQWEPAYLRPSGATRAAP